jgi:hypothetical protein
MLDDSLAKPLTAGRCIHASGVELGRAGSHEAAEDFREIVGLSKPQRLAISLTGRSEWLVSSEEALINMPRHQIGRLHLDNSTFGNLDANAGVRSGS